MSELDDFIRDFRLRPRQGAHLLGVSPRTLRRWRRRGVVPQHARDMIEVCREGRPPVNHSVARGPWIGVELYTWRSRLFGPSWRDWRAPDFHGYRRRRLP